MFNAVGLASEPMPHRFAKFANWSPKLSDSLFSFCFSKKIWRDSSLDHSNFDKDMRYEM